MIYPLDAANIVPFVGSAEASSALAPPSLWRIRAGSDGIVTAGNDGGANLLHWSCAPHFTTGTFGTNTSLQEAAPSGVPSLKIEMATADRGVWWDTGTIAASPSPRTFSFKAKLAPGSGAVNAYARIFRKTPTAGGLTVGSDVAMTNDWQTVSVTFTDAAATSLSLYAYMDGANRSILVADAQLEDGSSRGSTVLTVKDLNSTERVAYIPDANSPSLSSHLFTPSQSLFLPETATVGGDAAWGYPAESIRMGSDTSVSQPTEAGSYTGIAVVRTSNSASASQLFAIYGPSPSHLSVLRVANTSISILHYWSGGIVTHSISGLTADTTYKVIYQGVDGGNFTAWLDGSSTPSIDTGITGWDYVTGVTDPKIGGAVGAGGNLIDLAWYGGVLTTAERNAWWTELDALYP